jgi:hypothetical protein
MANQIARLEGVASGWAGIEFMKSKLMWSRPPRITAPPERGTELVVNARRKVVRVARTPYMFSFLSMCRPDVPIILGDAGSRSPTPPTGPTTSSSSMHSPPTPSPYICSRAKPWRSTSRSSARTAWWSCTCRTGTSSSPKWLQASPQRTGS